MKMTVILWAQVQNHLPGGEGDGSAETTLWRRIERYTDGKLYRTNVAIQLTKEDQDLVLAAWDAAVAAGDIKDAEKPNASKRPLAAYHWLDNP